MERKINLLHYLPEILQPIREYQLLSEIESPEFIQLYQETDRLLRNSFIETADLQGIKRWEQLIGIHPESQDIEERRTTILGCWNRSLPYTMTRLREYLDVLAGGDGYQIILRPQDYYLELLAEDQPLAVLRAMRSLILAMIPANLLFCLADRIPTAAMQLVESKSGFIIRGDFYPRYNVELLFMDGSWELNGEYSLDGYKTGQRIDFYPMRIQLASRTRVETKERQKLRILSDAAKKAELSLGMRSLGRAAWKEKNKSGMKLRSRFLKWMREESVTKTGSEASLPVFCSLQPVIRSPTVLDQKEQSAAGFQSEIPCMKRAILLMGGRSKIREKLRSGSIGKSLVKASVKGKSVTRMYFQSGASQETCCQLALTVEKDLWYLDGQTLLDGSRGLDAEIVNYKL